MAELPARNHEELNGELGDYASQVKAIDSIGATAWALAIVPAGALRVGLADAQSAFGPRPAPGALPPPPSALAEALRSRGVRNVVVCGLALEYCVLSTALGAADARFDSVVVVLEASRAIDAASARASPRGLADAAEAKFRDTGVRVRVVQTVAEALAEGS